MDELLRRPVGPSRFTRARRGAGVAAAGVALALVAALLAPTRAAAVPEPGPAAVPPRYLEQAIDWRTCDFSDFAHDVYAGAPVMRCARVSVPMDWQHPDAHPDITLSIAYSRATGPTKGLLTTNPGGPGESGVRFTHDLATFAKHQMFAYDLLGFDPRGFGESEQLHCRTTVSRLPEVADLRLRDTKTHTVERQVARIFADACSATELSPFISTQQTVFDVEFLRQLLGQGQPAYDKLNYLGFSYGTWLGVWYADTYPTHTGRFLLDSNMDWTRTMYTNQTFRSFAFERRRDKMFYPWVARRNKTYHLGTTSAKVAKRYERIRARVAAAWKRDALPISPVQADALVMSGLVADDHFADTADQIGQLDAMAAGSLGAAGERRLVTATRRAAALPPGLTARPTDNAERELEGLGGDALRCNDTALPAGGPTALLKRADHDAKVYPFVGYTNTVSLCSYWKFSPSPRTIDLAGVPRMLMLQAEGDPVTAYEGARAAHQATASHTRLVSVDNEGQHGLYARGLSPCAEKIGDAFLFKGVLPTRDKTCTTSPLPHDRKVYQLTGPLDGKAYSLG